MTPPSLALKSKVAPVALVGSAGAESIDVTGRVRSTVTLTMSSPVFEPTSVATARSAAFPSAGSGHEAVYGAAVSVPSEIQVPVEQSLLASVQAKNSTPETSPSGLVAVTVNGSASARFTNPLGAVIETLGSPAFTTHV